MKDYCIILCTTPDQGSAQKLAYHLVGDRLAACCNIVPQIQSVYIWENKISEDEEHLLIIKTESDKFTAVEKAIKKLHPYDVPEIISTPLKQGSKSYLQWITKTVNPNENE